MEKHSSSWVKLSGSRDVESVLGNHWRSVQRKLALWALCFWKIKRVALQNGLKEEKVSGGEAISKATGTEPVQEVGKVCTEQRYGGTEFKVSVTEIRTKCDVTSSFLPLFICPLPRPVWFCSSVAFDISAPIHGGLALPQLSIPLWLSLRLAIPSNPPGLALIRHCPAPFCSAKTSVASFFFFSFMLTVALAGIYWHWLHIFIFFSLFY